MAEFTDRQKTMGAAERAEEAYRVAGEKQEHEREIMRPLFHLILQHSQNHANAYKQTNFIPPAEYFRQRKAQGVTDEWPATVLGWQRQDLKLAAVLLDELGLEVVIKVGGVRNDQGFLWKGGGRGAEIR